MKCMVLIAACVVVVVPLVPAEVDTGNGPRLPRWTIDNGGVTNSRGGDWELSGTIGQPDPSLMEGYPYTLTGGFWVSLPPGDCDDTGCLDLLDYAELERCLAGPGTAAPAGCECFDVNHSSTVDLMDFAVAQTAFTGP